MLQLSSHAQQYKKTVQRLLYRALVFVDNSRIQIGNERLQRRHQFRRRHLRCRRITPSFLQLTFHFMCVSLVQFLDAVLKR